MSSILPVKNSAPLGIPGAPPGWYTPKNKSLVLSELFKFEDVVFVLRAIADAIKFRVDKRIQLLNLLGITVYRV
jgi:hypothetical protein